jgi:hypothetical protein
LAVPHSFIRDILNNGSAQSKGQPLIQLYLHLFSKIKYGQDPDKEKIPHFPHPMCFEGGPAKRVRRPA